MLYIYIYIYSVLSGLSISLRVMLALCRTAKLIMSTYRHINSIKVKLHHMRHLIISFHVYHVVISASVGRARQILDYHRPLCQLPT